MRRRRDVAIVIAALLAGCVFYPRVEVYNSPCGIEHKKLVLDVAVARDFNCGQGSASECLALIAALAPVSAVISGSIVVVGNTLFWTEKEGECPPKPKDAS